VVYRSMRYCPVDRKETLAAARYSVKNPSTREGKTMCTRFVCRGDDMITGFNFDIDLAVWDHKIIKEKDRFYIGILWPDWVRHFYHSVMRNGNVGTLLYVHVNPEGSCQDSIGCMTIADQTEQFGQAKISFDDALKIVKE